MLVPFPSLLPFTAHWPHLNIKFTHVTYPALSTRRQTVTPIPVLMSAVQLHTRDTFYSIYREKGYFVLFGMASRVHVHCFIKCISKPHFGQRTRVPHRQSRICLFRKSGNAMLLSLTVIRDPTALPVMLDYPSKSTSPRTLWHMKWRDNSPKAAF